MPISITALNRIVTGRQNLQGDGAFGTVGIVLGWICLCNSDHTLNIYSLQKKSGEWDDLVAYRIYWVIHLMRQRDIWNGIRCSRCTTGCQTSVPNGSPDRKNPVPLWGRCWHRAVDCCRHGI